MADMAKMQTRIRELEARREKGESVPELDVLYKKMDALTEKGYAEATKTVTGETPPAPVKKAKGGSVSSASARADGCAVRGKTKGKMV
jgi:hypothetical protein